MIEFHKLNARNSDEYLTVENKHQEFLLGFKDFSLNEKGNGTITKRSDKAGSYYRALIKLIIGYERVEQTKIDNLFLHGSLNKLNKFLNSNLIKESKVDKKGFYRASLKTYERYLSFLTNENEEKLDFEMDFQSNLFRDDQLSVEKPIAQKHKEKPKIKQVNNLLSYVRDPYQAYLIKEKSEWLCDYDSTHITFINKSNNKQYVEAHHLIPMSYQGEYEYSIDILSNLVSLCPNCHKKIHYGQSEVKKELISDLYDKKKEEYKNHDIDISLGKLLSYYAINRDEL